ncbi:mechanosensitive ion channel [Candidatus Poribacteria bacterium]|nr:mechanosensitive ion channel [Candidatus Poribacteria bacterium]
MDEFLQQFRALFERHVITLGDEPVQVYQIVLLIGIVAATVVLGGFLRRWFRRFFNRFRMQENLANRLLAFLFLIVLIFGTSLAFRVAKVSTGFLGELVNYPLTGLFQPSQKLVETQTGEEGTLGETDASKPKPTADTDGDHNQLTLARLFYGFVIVFGMFILSKYVQWVLRRQVLQAFQIEQHTQFILLRFLHFTLIIIGVLISLSTIGVSFTNLAIIFGGLSIGIGFGLQNIASNLIAGFILIFERPIKIGDLVEIMDVDIFGRVHSINLRSTVIVALDEKEVIVPNSQLVTEPVHNLTHYNNQYRLRISVGVSYGSDVELVKKALLEVADAHPEVIKQPTLEMENVAAPLVRFTSYGAYSLNFELLAWVPDAFNRFDVASDLHFMVWEKFKAYDIEIPFPQHDVHLYPKESDA